MEGFQEVGNTKPILKSIKHGLSNQTSEQFGFFVYVPELHDYDFIESDNQSLFDPNQFMGNSNHFYKYFLDKKVISLFHTHTIESPEPSKIDIAISESLGIPSYVFSVHSKKAFLYYPDSYVPNDLLNRIFVPAFSDCLIFVKDFYQIKLNIKLSKYIKNWARQPQESNNIVLKYLNNLFYEINDNQLRLGDVIVFKPQDSSLFHLGVYCEQDSFLHHPIYSRPKKEVFNKETLNKVYKIYRFKEL